MLYERTTGISRAADSVARRRVEVYPATADEEGIRLEFSVTN